MFFKLFITVSLVICQDMWHTPRRAYCKQNKLSHDINNTIDIRSAKNSSHRGRDGTEVGGTEVPGRAVAKYPKSETQITTTHTARPISAQNVLFSNRQYNKRQSRGRKKKWDREDDWAVDIANCQGQVKDGRERR